jgi:hypothetical protein
MKDLAKTYPLLSAEERFRLFVQAAARQDHQELDRLNNSCPQYTYRCEDYEYTMRKTQFMFIALYFSQELRRLELNANMGLLLAVALECAEDPNPEDPETVAKVDRALEKVNEAMRIRGAKLEGWRQFCQKIGIPENTPPELIADEEQASMNKRLEASVGNVAPEPSVAEKTFSLLCEAWANLTE